MRWIMVAVAAFGFALVVLGGTPGMIGIGFALGLVGLCGALVAFAAVRVASGTRPETEMLGREEIAAMRARSRAADAPVRPDADGSESPRSRGDCP
jgi:hypothetical protein